MTPISDTQVTMSRRSKVVGALTLAASIVLGACGGGNAELEQAQNEIEALVETEEGRLELALSLASTSPLTIEQSICFVQNSETEVLAGILALGGGDNGLNASEVVEDLREGLETCGVRLDAFEQ